MRLTEEFIEDTLKAKKTLSIKYNCKLLEISHADDDNLRYEIPNGILSLDFHNGLLLVTVSNGSARKIVFNSNSLEWKEVVTSTIYPTLGEAAFYLKNKMVVFADGITGE